MTSPDTLTSLKAKLHPHHVETSPKMTAIVSFLLGGWKDVEIEPGIAEMMVTSDGYILARNSDDIGFNFFIGSEDDLNSNCEGIAEVVELNEDELALWRELRKKVQRDNVP